MSLSHFVPAYPSPSPYPQVHSLVGLCLYSRLAPRFFMTFFFFFRFHIYVLAYMMEYYSAIKRDEIELFVVRWMDLESVIQSEVSQK